MKVGQPQIDSCGFVLPESVKLKLIKEEDWKEQLGSSMKLSSKTLFKSFPPLKIKIELIIFSNDQSLNLGCVLGVQFEG